MVVHAAKNAYLGKLAPKDSYYFANDEIFCHFFAYKPSFFLLLSSYSYDFAAFSLGRHHNKSRLFQGTTS